MMEEIFNVDGENEQVIIIRPQKSNESVSKEEFDATVAHYYSTNTSSNRAQYWTKLRVTAVIQTVEEYKFAPALGIKRSNIHYSRGRLYDIMEIGDKKLLILKRKSEDSPIVEVVPAEDYYEKLNECHKATGHGGRVKMIQVLKKQLLIPRPVVEIYLKLCTTCNQKKTLAKTGTVVHPIQRDNFNNRGQIEIIDFQSSPDRDFKWLLNYQDLSTKFCYLRPLRSKRAPEVVAELLKIFLEFGCPAILQGNNGCKFTPLFIKELNTMWPECSIISGHQDSVENCKGDVENLLKAWMHDNNCTTWSIGCYFVQWQKNSSYESTIKRSPYRALFGANPKIELKSCNIPTEILANIHNEEDFQSVQTTTYSETQASDNLGVVTDTSTCCSKCNLNSLESFQELYSLCQQEMTIGEEGDKSVQGQKRAAEKMLNTSVRKFKKN